MESFRENPIGRQRRMPKRPPIPRYLRQTVILRFGPGVRHFTDSVKGSNLLERIQKLGYKIAKIPIYRLPGTQLRKLYAKRGAEQIIRDNAVYAKRKGAFGPEISGCVDHAHVAVACLRYMGVEARFVRWAVHSMAAFALEGKEYFLDPFAYAVYGENPLRELTGQEKIGLEIGKKKGLYYEGHDASDIDLDYRHFRKPGNESRKVSPEETQK